MNRLLSAAVASLALLASPAVAQSALSRGHDEMNAAGRASAELTLLLGICQPNLSDNHVNETRTNLIEGLKLEPSRFDALFNQAVEERAKMPASELELYTPLECRVMFNELVREVNGHLREAKRLYQEAEQ